MACAYDGSLRVAELDVEGESASPTTLDAFRGGKRLVLDFWHTRCTRCPAALTKLDMLAPKHADVTFASCALSLGSTTEGTCEVVLELLQDQWENLKHLYMEFEDKEKAKAQFGFTQLPFCVVFGADGAVLYRGDPGQVDFATVFDAEPAAPAKALAQTPAPAKALAQTPAAPASALAQKLDGVSVDSPSSITAAVSQQVGHVGSEGMAAAKPLVEANRAGVVLGFGNDDEDF